MKEKKPRKLPVGDQIVIPVAAIEFHEGGHTIWVQSVFGTVLRLKCTGKIKVNRKCSNLVDHADAIIQGDMEICMPTK